MSGAEWTFPDGSVLRADSGAALEHLNGLREQAERRDAASREAEAFRTSIWQHLQSRGFDPGRVDDSTIMITKSQRILEAGTDYDRYYQHSKPGDYTTLKNPSTMEFVWYDDDDRPHREVIDAP